MIIITNTFYLSLKWLILTLLVYLFTKNLLKSNRKTICHPPSPPALPFIGHLHLLSRILPVSLQTLASQYGPLMKITVGSSTSLVVSDATVAGEIMKVNDDNFSLRPDFGSSGFRIYEDAFISADDGTCWRFLKKICMTILLSNTRLNYSAHIRKQEVMNLLEVVLKCSEKREACDIGVEMMRLTNNIICRMSMSTRCLGSASEGQKIRELVREIMELGGKLSMGEVLGPLKNLDLFGYGKRVRALLLEYDELAERILKEHEMKRDDGDGEVVKDMMDVLLEINKDGSAGVKLIRNDIKFFFLVMFLAGTDTTSAALQWTLAELINHPLALKKLRNEIITVVGRNRLVEESDLPSLPYLQAIVKESLRLHPTLPLIMRKNKKDCKINGYDVLATSRVLINTYAIMRDPKSWTKPNDFLPERFMQSTEENYCGVEDQKLHFLPFGNGRRTCIGASLAITVIGAGIGALVQCFDWEVKGGEKINMEMGIGISAGMANPLVCYPIKLVNPLEFPNVAK